MLWRRLLALWLQDSIARVPGVTPVILQASKQLEMRRVRFVMSAERNRAAVNYCALFIADECRPYIQYVQLVDNNSLLPYIR